MQHSRSKGSCVHLSAKRATALAGLARLRLGSSAGASRASRRSMQVGGPRVATCHRVSPVSCGAPRWRLASVTWFIGPSEGVEWGPLRATPTVATVVRPTAWRGWLIDPVVSCSSPTVASSSVDGERDVASTWPTLTTLRPPRVSLAQVHASLFGVGAPEALVIGVVALLVFGPKGLADIAKQLGQTLRAFQPTIRELQEVSREFKETLEDEIGLDEIRNPPPAVPKPKPRAADAAAPASPLEAESAAAASAMGAKEEVAAGAEGAEAAVTEEMKRAAAEAAWGAEPPAAAAADASAAAEPAPPNAPEPPAPANDVPASLSAPVADEEKAK